MTYTDDHLGEPTPAVLTYVPPRRRRRLATALAAAGVVVLVAFVVTVFYLAGLWITGRVG